uniref:G-protein coupled receptors family 1 profile domain-containing protein n=1 Tax=Electrophorus electricus TaxID=8005 RepID=A0A4W4GGQ8_ELEEL
MEHGNGSDLDSAGDLSRANLVSSVLMGLFCAVGIPGNAVVVVVILLWFKKDNFTVQLMLNLAASDILSLMTLPMWMYNQLNVWRIGRTLCKSLVLLAYCSVYSSLLTVTVMSVHRCMQVCYPTRWAKLGKRGETALLLTIWILGLACSVPPVLTQEVLQKGTKKECGRIMSQDNHRLFVTVLETLLAFVIPFSIMVTSYYCIHKKVTRGALFRSRRMTRIVTRIVVTFFIFWTPYHIINLVEIAGILLKKSQPHSADKLLLFINSLGDVAGSFTFINSCVNPLLYAFASRSLRQSSKTEHTNTLPTSSPAIIFPHQSDSISKELHQ